MSPFHQSPASLLTDSIVVEIDSLFIGHAHQDTLLYLHHFSVSALPLPSTLTSIGAGTFGGCGQLDTLYCHAKTPPVITDNTFNNYTTYKCKVFVQKSSLAQYKSATGWKKFTNYITIPDEDQGIEEVIANGKLADKQKVLIDGQLYILRGEKVYTVTGQEVR